MALTRPANRLADKLHKRIAGALRSGIGARLAIPALAVDPARRNARESDARTFLAP